MKKILLLFISFCLIVIIFLLIQIISLIPERGGEVTCQDMLDNYFDSEMINPSRQEYEKLTGCDYIQTRINSLLKKNTFTK